MQYVATGNDVKIYMETSNGVQRGGKEYNKVGVSCNGVSNVAVCLV